MSMSPIATNEHAKLDWCPFCGGTAKLHTTHEGLVDDGKTDKRLYRSAVRCPDCGASGPEIGRIGMDAAMRIRLAVTGWNHRQLNC